MHLLSLASASTSTAHTDTVRAQHFLDMLKQNKTLKKLELGNCGITDAGVKNVIKAFSKGGVASKNNTLEHLGLFNNDDAVDEFLPHVCDLLEPEGRKSRGGK